MEPEFHEEQEVGSIIDPSDRKSRFCLKREPAGLLILFPIRDVT